MQGAVGRVFCMGMRREVECIVVGGGQQGRQRRGAEAQGRDVLVLDALEFPGQSFVPDG